MQDVLQGTLRCAPLFLALGQVGLWLGVCCRAGCVDGLCQASSSRGGPAGTPRAVACCWGWVAGGGCWCRGGVH
jgi:hypothetical protein